MCDEVGSQQHKDISVLDFVQQVWGLDRATGQQILELNLSPDPVDLYAYRHSSCLEEMHRSFNSISKSLLTSVVSELGLPSTFVCDTFWGGITPNLICLGRDQYPLRSSLHSAKHLIEFKNEGFKNLVPRLSQAEKTGLMKAFKSGPIQCSKSGRHPRSNPNSARRATSDHVPVHTPFLSLNPPLGKRGYESGDSTSDGRRPTKQARLSQRARLGDDAIECLAETARRWVTGLFIDSFEVTACYFDRRMVACSTPFHFDRNPAALALLLYAVNSCTRDQAGLDPNLFSSPTADTAMEEARDGPDLPASQMVGLCFNFTSRAVDDRDSKGNRQNQSCDRGQKDDVDDSLNPVVEEHKRRAIQGSIVEPSSCFRIAEFIRKPDELLGRATAVYKAHRSLSNDEFCEEPCALKLSWPLKSRTFEIDILKHLKGVLPSSSHDHFPHIFFSQTWTAEQMKIPSLGLNLSFYGESQQERVLCALAAKYYKKLWQAGSIENFKRVWLDCVEVSYLAYKIGGILHRDISENNLMVSPLHNGKAKGVLNDWDMAQFFEKEHNDSSSRRHQIGTPPFMAIDLLPLSTDGLKVSDEGTSDGEGSNDSVQQHQSPSCHPHWPRHQLESLFYVLVWAALHYNLKKGTRDPEPHALVQSWTRDSDQNAMAKRAMLSPIQGYPELLCKSLKPSFRKSELAQWIESLRKLLSGARIRYEFAVQGGEESDAPTYGGRLTFKKFMGAIGVAPRTWGIAGYLDDED